MIRLIALASLALLSACGVDGPPIPPSQAAAAPPPPAVSLTGTAEIGIVGSGG